MASTAQDLNLKTLEGNATSLSNQLSKTMWTLVMVWTTYCGECAKQYDEISAFHQNNNKSNEIDTLQKDFLIRIKYCT